MPRAAKAVDDVLLLMLLHEEQVENLEKRKKSIQVEIEDGIVKAHEETHGGILVAFMFLYRIIKDKKSKSTLVIKGQRSKVPPPRRPCNS